MSSGSPFAYIALRLANSSLVFAIALLKNWSGGNFRHSTSHALIDSAMLDVTCPNRGIGKNARTQCSRGMVIRYWRAGGETTPTALIAAVYACSFPAFAMAQTCAAAAFPYRWVTFCAMW